MDLEPYNIITKDGIKYKFTWSSVGWTYAKININIIKSFLGVKFWWPVYSSTESTTKYGLSQKQMEEMLPNEFKRQCEYTLNKYLTYKNEWDKVKNG